MSNGIGRHPILLDRHHYPKATQEWFGQYDLEGQWAGEDSSGDDAWYEHVDRARQLLNGELTLGRPPDDLAEVLALFALGGPAICALRALDRFTGPTLASHVGAEMRQEGLAGHFEVFTIGLRSLHSYVD